MEKDARKSINVYKNILNSIDSFLLHRYVIGYSIDIFINTDHRQSSVFARLQHGKHFTMNPFEIKVPESRSYVVRSNSVIGTYGYIYENSFDSLNPAKNLIASDNDGGDLNRQFKLEIPLYTNTTYILVVTTYSARITGEIKITLLGLTDVIIKSLSKLR